MKHPSAVSAHLVVQGPDAEVQQHRETEHDAGVAEGEEEPGRQRPLALADELAGGVVDRGDVVGVESASHAEGVGEDAGAEAEDLRPGDVIVGVDRGGQHPPAHDVQADDHARHSPGPRPLSGGQRVTDSCQPAVRPGR
jgi:hypothetical protein